jgi:hypothetical protein
VSWVYAEETLNSTAGGRTPLKRVLHLTQFYYLGVSWVQTEKHLREEEDPTKGQVLDLTQR